MDIKVQIIATELAEAINHLAAALQASKSEPVLEAKEDKRPSRRSKNEKAKDTPADEPADEEKEDPAEEVTATVEKDEDMFDDEPALTREDVQKRLKEIAGAGKAAGIKKLLTSYNVKKFSELPEDKLAEILEKAEAL